MLIEPSFEQQELLAETLRRGESGMNVRERIAEVLIGAGFAVAVIGLWRVSPPHGFVVGPTAICFVLLAIAALVRFETPFGFTVPTQLAFVPLLFSAPVAVAPLVVVSALALARLAQVLRREAAPSRLLLTPGNSWFAIGPAAVFALAHVEPRAATAGVLVAALAAQFAVDFGASSLRYGIARDATLSSQLGELGVYVIDAALSGIGLVVARQMHSSVLAGLALLPLFALLAVFARERHHRLESLLELGNAYRGTALVLGDVVEADDGYTGEHSRGVVGLALDVGDALQLRPKQQRNLEFAALLHDVGKIVIPKDIINKPGKLDPDEWTIIKTHTVQGQRMLERVGGFMREVGTIVRAHHERWDGSGYPDGLAADAIPLEARIIACCDSWNAMRTDRAYRKALSHEQAIAELRAGAGTQFDPGIVELLLEIVDPASERVAVPLSLRLGRLQVADSPAT